MNKKKSSILIVDDISENIQVLLKIFKDECNILAATNGKRAIELALSENQPDLILLDIMMPDMDGYEVCKQLKNSEKTRDIPIIFVTVLDEDKNELKGLKLGAVDYITKPINPDLVRARVFNHLELKQHRDNLKIMLQEKEDVMIAQSRNASMGEMIEMIIHQWRQPLTTISVISNLEILDASSGNIIDNEKLIENMEKINKSLGYLSHTIDDFRYFFTQNKEKENIKIGDVIKEAQNLFGSSLNTNNISISIEDNDFFEVKSNSNALVQVYINLIKNAKDALIEKREENRYIKITVSDDEENIITTFCDNARGIDEGIIDKVFNPHFSTKDKKDSTGLGLYISKIIVEKTLNGTISVKNTKDGACFKVTIPKAT